MNTKEDNSELIKINEIMEQMNNFHQTMYDNNEEGEDNSGDIVEEKDLNTRNKSLLTEKIN